MRPLCTREEKALLPNSNAINEGDPSAAAAAAAADVDDDDHGQRGDKSAAELARLCYDDPCRGMIEVSLTGRTFDRLYFDFVVCVCHRLRFAGHNRCWCLFFPATVRYSTESSSSLDIQRCSVGAPRSLARQQRRHRDGAEGVRVGEGDECLRRFERFNTTC